MCALPLIRSMASFSKKLIDNRSNLKFVSIVSRELKVSETVMSCARRFCARVSQYMSETHLHTLSQNKKEKKKTAETVTDD